jgi:diguanylate cyclase (GGDEF)-like protein/PAS domain S-box-containing protein
MSLKSEGKRVARSKSGAPAASEAALTGFPGPTLEITADGAIKALNDAGRRLMAALDGRAASEAATALLDLIKTAFDQGAAARTSLTLPGDNDDEGAPRTLDTTVVPAGPKHAFVIAVDVTDTLDALAGSERRYRDLVDLAADFAWETGPDGCFTFVSGSGAFGYASRLLVGKNPRDLLLRESGAATILPFNTPAPVRQQEVWVRNAEGGPVCLSVSAMPVFGEDGKRVGARGVCLDVTSSRLVDTSETRRKERERAIKAINDAVLKHNTAKGMLDTAVRAICHAVDGSACEAFLFDDHGRPIRAAQFGDTGMAERYSVQLVKRMDPSDLHQAVVAGRPVLGMMTGGEDGATAAFLVWHVEPNAEWTEENELLMVELREQFSGIVSQIAEQRKLETLSRFDELTGLVNRRFFHEELDARLESAQGRGKRGTLIYVDLDNFKLVNDKQGHDKGDAVLRKLADILRGNTREYDLIGRLGGDEFVMWLDDTDANVAIKRGENLLAAARTLKGLSGAPDKPLAVSLGIAIYDPRSGEGRDALIARADAAMYEAKHGGKGRLAMAPAAEPVPKRMKAG